MKFLLISDTQLGMADHSLQGEKWRNVAKEWIGNKPLKPEIGLQKEMENLRTFVDYANNENPDFVVLCGDVINNVEDFEAIEKFKLEISNLSSNIPLYISPGNHDVGENPEIPSKSGLEIYRKYFGDDYFAFKNEKILFMVLNSSLLMNPDALVSEYDAQMDFIDNQLNSLDKGSDIIIFSHHPPFLKRTELLSENLRNLTEGKELTYWTYSSKVLVELFQKFDGFNLRTVFSGHLHTNAFSVFQNTEIIVTSSLGLPLGLCSSGFRKVAINQGIINHSFIVL